MARNILVNSLLTIFILLVTGSYLTDTKMFIVMSNSMAPKLKRGDLILVKEQESYSVNDVITFMRNSETVTHRITSSSNNSFKTKGFVFSSAAITPNNEIVIGSFDGYIYILDSEGNFISKYDTHGRIFSSPIIL